MPLIPYLADRLHLISGVSWDDLDPCTPAGVAALKRFEEYQDDGDSWSVPSDVDVKDFVIPGPRGSIPVRLYRPQHASPRYLLWVHGGGFFTGSIDMPESHMVGAELASRANTTVLAVEYRLASPQTLYPAPLDDVAAAWSWLSEFAAREAHNPVLIMGGASAGASLALATALRAPESVDRLLLVYPFVHFPVPALNTSTALEMNGFPPLLRFTPAAIEMMVRRYVGRTFALPLDALPGHAINESLRAPLSILIAEYDDLRPSGELLAAQYREVGGRVEVRLEAGVPHGHLNRLPIMPGVEDSLQWLVATLAATEQTRPPHSKGGK